MRELDLQAEALAMRRLWLSVAVLIAAAACAWPEAAQQAVGGGPALVPAHPTDAGKPVIYDRQFIAKPEEEDGGCAPSLSCRLRLFGVIQITITVPSKLRATARFAARISSRAKSAPRIDIIERRTYSGRPSSSMRFSEATAMATSVVCRLRSASAGRHRSRACRG